MTYMVNLPDLPPEPAEWARQQRSVARSLSFAAVRPGMRVLELGSVYDGYAASVLAELVGPGGSVISVSPTVDTAERAISAHGTGAYGRLAFQFGSLLDGWPPGAPYDLIVSTCVIRRIPYAWLQQCGLPNDLFPIAGPAGIVAPMLVRGYGAARLLRIEVDEEQQPTAPQLLHPARQELPRLHDDRAGYALHIHRARAAEHAQLAGDRPGLRTP